ncbi:MAG: KpsF/GutQ family sugar-phosphate isomerase [Ignavibacteriaceae bacterium]|nr:MAG: KpsF/GutQ family sugar-phosphate isomerase [Ignavibacteriaceae bacterium]MBW7873657.1 KpsF/GutQ family sugar-phosphate isomerase [Ignavibacteria bacterium]
MKLEKEQVLRLGRDVIRIEAESVNGLLAKIDEGFARAVELIFRCEGRVVLTGVGKSGLIARKIVATMNSTGTPAIYLHPTDALHGDLGMVRQEDVVILLSKSGATEEMMMLIPMLKRLGVSLIGLLGDSRSKMAKQMDVVLDVEVSEEACPYDLAPTASTTAALVMGDALSVALLKLRGFTEQDFAMLHPGGSLGKRLSLKISEIMYKGEAIPVVHETTSFKDSILEITSKRLGVTCVVDSSGKLLGVITDGDLRRLLERTTELSTLRARDMMTENPKKIKPGQLASYALQKMENYKITTLPVTDKEDKPVGIVHLHDLVNLGLRMR